MTDPAECVDQRPRQPLLAVWGMVCLVGVIYATLVTEPRPDTHGNGLIAAIGLAAFVLGIVLVRPNWDPRGRGKPRGELDIHPGFVGLMLVVAASWTLTAVQRPGAGSAGIYFAIVIAGIGLDRIPAVAIAGLALGGELVVYAYGTDVGDHVITLLVSAIPWFLVMRLIRGMRASREALERSQAAQARSAAAAERGKLARDMHDVLAHSLSALALQLESARLLARNRDADPEVVAAIERAHHLAAGGLAEARQAIATLRGDSIPGPERLRSLAAGFEEQSGVPCSLRVRGDAPTDQSSEERLALYRTAQEALTNVRKHSAAERVEIDLHYGPDGTALAVRDHGAGVPVATVANGNGGGYGLTGMRERAELLGGRLSAELTADGFEVRLWLPA